MLPARSAPRAPIRVHPFFPRVIQGLLAAPGYDEMMAVAALLAGYDVMAAEIGADQGSPTIWDDVMDIRLSCL